MYLMNIIIVKPAVQHFVPGYYIPNRSDSLKLDGISADFLDGFTGVWLHIDEVLSSVR